MATKMVRKDLRDDLEIWSSPILTNMLWIILCVPLVTMPLAFVGLLASMFHWMDDRNTRVFTIFFGTIRRVWYKAYAVLLLDLLIGGFLYFNLLMFQVMDMSDIFAFLSRSMTFITCVIFLLVNVHLWVLIAIWDVPLKRILIFSVQLTFAQPLWSIATGVGFVSTFIFATIMPSAVFIVCIGAIAAYIACRGTWLMVGKYIPADQFEFITFRV